MSKTIGTKKYNGAFRILRSLLRRRQCAYITLCELLTLFVFVSLAILGAYFYQRYSEMRARLDHEDDLLAKISNRVTFAHCKYDSAVKNYSVDYCGDRSRQAAFAWRNFHLSAEHRADKSCLDRHEQVDCHDMLEQIGSPKELAIAHEHALKGLCPGLHGQPIFEFTGSTKQSLTFLIDNLTLFQDMTLHASELIVQCPVCRQASTAVKKFPGSSCFIKVSTVHTGWPAVAYECDEQITLPLVRDCTVLQ